MKTQKDPMHLDAGESAIFARQLDYVKAQSYDVKHKNLKATTLIPVSTEAPSGADVITFRRFDMVGLAKIVSDYANDFPRADVYGTEESAKVRSLGSSFGYSVKEIRRSQMAGTNLDQRRANAARRAIDELLERLAFTGDSNFNINGLINYPGISDYTVPNDGTGTSKLWSTKTPDQIVRDITGLISFIVSSTNGREAPDTLLLPIDQYMLIANTRMTDGNDKTILTFVLENNPYLKLIDWLPELKSAGVGATNRMLAYTRDPEHLTLEIPQPYEQFTPQQKGMEFEVPCHMETAGVICYYPLSVAFGDGI